MSGKGRDRPALDHPQLRPAPAELRVDRGPKSFGGDLGQARDAPRLVVAQYARESPLGGQRVQAAPTVGPMGLVRDSRTDVSVVAPDQVAVGRDLARDDSFPMAEGGLDDDGVRRAGDRVYRERDTCALRHRLLLDDDRHSCWRAVAISAHTLAV